MQSVIIPVRNGADLIAQAIASALLQLASDDEIIVVDNGSTDETAGVVKAFADPRVRLVAEARPGPAAASNTGLAVARGNLVSFLDHDDYWPVGRNLGLLAALASDPDADAAYGRIRIRIEPDASDPGFSKADGTLTTAFGFHVLLFRRQIIDRVGRMDETLPLGSDADYLNRLRLAGMRTVTYDGDAAVYRRHSGNITNDRAGTARAMLGVLARNVARKRSS